MGTGTDETTIVEAFTALAPNYETAMDRELQVIWGIDYPRFADRLVDIASVDERSSVLDIATGTAVLPIRFAHQNPAPGRIVGLDITPAMLAQGRQHLKSHPPPSEVELVCASATDIPFADETFDTAICGLGMHHMPVPEVLSELERILKHNGRLFVACVGAPPIWRTRVVDFVLRSIAAVFVWVFNGPRARAEADAAFNIHTAEEWRGLLKQAGFTKFRIEVELRGQRFWYPDALMLKATKGGRAIS